MPDDAQRGPIQILFHTQRGARRVVAVVARTPADRAVGLSGVRDLPDGFGMLFVWPRDAQSAFTTAATPIPLDLVYLGRDGFVLAVVPARALDPTPYAAPTTYRAVLECPGGFAARTGIAPGVRFTVADDAWTHAR